MSTTLKPIHNLGTTWFIEIFDDVTQKKLSDAHMRIESFLSIYNAHYSRFLPDSFITRLNTERTLQNSTEELRDIIRIGQTWFTNTHGIFNILVEEELVRRGYDSSYSFQEKTSSESVTFANPVTDISITETHITLNRGRIDLGGFGKGYAIDRIADLLKSVGMQYFLINGGGDIYATTDHGKPITIYLEHPTRDAVFLGETTLTNEAFASSSPYKREWKGAAGTQHHLVQTSNIEPEAIASYVKASSAVDADIIATTTALSPSFLDNRDYAMASFNPHTGIFTHTPTFTPLELFI